MAKKVVVIRYAEWMAWMDASTPPQHKDGIVCKGTTGVEADEEETLLSVVAQSTGVRNHSNVNNQTPLRILYGFEATFIRELHGEEADAALEHSKKQKPEEAPIKSGVQRPGLVVPPTGARVN